MSKWITLDSSEAKKNSKHVQNRAAMAGPTIVLISRCEEFFPSSMEHVVSNTLTDLILTAWTLLN